jgi:hypothetical protein
VLLGCWQLLSLVPKGRAERCLLLTTLTKSKFQIFPATFYKTENAIPCPGTKLTIHCGLQPPAQIQWHRWPYVSRVLLLWQCSQMRNQATLRGVENSDFIFTPVSSDVYLCLSTEQRIHKIFKR